MYRNSSLERKTLQFQSIYNEKVLRDLDFFRHKYLRKKLLDNNVTEKHEKIAFGKSFLQSEMEKMNEEKADK